MDRLPRFVTARLAVSPWEAELRARRDGLAGELAAVVTSEVTAFLPPGLQVTAGDTDMAVWAEDLAGDAAVSLLRRDGVLAGLLILDLAEVGCIRIGYLLGRSFWGQGLASELVVGFVAHLQALGFVGEVVGGVEPGNPASAAVLLKAGFHEVPGAGTGEAVDYKRRIG